jgi:hypothetical protein
MGRESLRDQRFGFQRFSILRMPVPVLARLQANDPPESAAIRHPRARRDLISAFQIVSVSAFQICPGAFAQVFRRMAL